MVQQKNSTRFVITIGRDASNDVVCKDRCVSRHHARLTCRAAQWIVTDLGSLNGTYVNDERIHAETPLKYGDRLRLSHYGPEFMFPDDFSLPVPVPPPVRKTSAFRQHFSRTVVLIAKAAQQDSPHVTPKSPLEPPPPAPRAQQSLYDFIRSLAQLSPRSAVLESWRILETAVRHCYKDTFRRKPPMGATLESLINELHTKKLLDEKKAKALHDLRNLRNKAAHHTIFALDPTHAEAYAVQCLSYARLIYPASCMAAERELT